MADEKTIEELKAENAALQQANAEKDTELAEAEKANADKVTELAEAEKANAEKDEALLDLSVELENASANSTDKNDPVVLTRGKRKVVLTIPRAKITLGKGRDKKVVIVTAESLKADDKLFDQLLKMRYGGFSDYVAPKKAE